MATIYEKSNQFRQALLMSNIIQMNSPPPTWFSCICTTSRISFLVKKKCKKGYSPTNSTRKFVNLHTWELRLSQAAFSNPRQFGNTVLLLFRKNNCTVHIQEERMGKGKENGRETFKGIGVVRYRSAVLKIFPRKGLKTWLLGLRLGKASYAHRHCFKSGCCSRGSI